MITGQENQAAAKAHKAWAPILELSAREVFSLNVRSGAGNEFRASC